MKVIVRLLQRGSCDVGSNLMNLTNRRHGFMSQIDGSGLPCPEEPFNATLTVRYRFP